MPPSPGDPVLDARILRKTFATGRSGPRRSRGRAVDGVEPAACTPASPRHRRRIRLRQVDPGPDAGRPRTAGLRHDHHQRTRRHHGPRSRAPADARPCPDGVPGSVHLVGSADERARPDLRAVGKVHAGQGHGRLQGPGRRTARAGESGAGDDAPLPAPVLGGQRQRIGIARRSPSTPRCWSATNRCPRWTCRCRPRWSNLLRELQRRMGIALVFIAHDLSVVRHVSGPHGRDVSGTAGRGWRHQYGVRHPGPPVHVRRCCRRLRWSTSSRRRLADRITLIGDPPQPGHPTGRRFHTRCRFAEAAARPRHPWLAPPGHSPTAPSPVTSPKPPPPLSPSPTWPRPAPNSVRGA